MKLSDHFLWGSTETATSCYCINMIWNFCMEVRSLLMVPSNRLRRWTSFRNCQGSNYLYGINYTFYRYYEFHTLSRLKYIFSHCVKLDDKVSYFPIMFCLMQHRDRESYLSLFQWIQELFQEEFPDHPGFKPEKLYRIVLIP